MPKVVSPQALDRIAELVARYPDGVGVGALSQALDVPRRTLQRRLSTLVAQKRITTDGEGRATKYRLAPIIGTASSVEDPSIMLAIGEVYVPTSPEGEQRTQSHRTVARCFRLGR